MIKKFYFLLLALGTCSIVSSCTPTRTYHVTETTYEATGPVVKESVVVVRRAPVRVYVEEFERDYIIVERPVYARRHMMMSHRYHHGPRYYRPYSNHSEFHFGFGFGVGR